MSKDYSSVITHLSNHYSELACLHGDKPQASQYTDYESHWRRMKVLAEIGIGPSAKILDFGCGTGGFLHYLKREHQYIGEYIGIDISEKQLQLASEKFSDVRFLCQDILKNPFGEEVDFVIINGVFNNKVPGNDGFSYMCDILCRLMPIVRKGIAFNAMSTYVDFFDEELVYFDPGRVFNFCKENLSNLVSLRHDYQIKPDTLPYEFCTYVYKDELKYRRNIAL